MEHGFSRPINETDFELFCLRFLQCYWPDSDPQRFGRKGQRQFGIDIIDMTTRSVPLRAAQVKFIGKPGEILSPAVIESEVNDAKNFVIEGERLSEYVILTTSEADTHCQLKVLAINKQHKKASLFAVMLLTWNLIEEIFRKHPDLWDLSIDRSLKCILRPLENQIAQMPSQLIMLMGITKLDNEFETQCDETLARAKQLVDGFHFNDALELLRRLETDSWSRLSSDDKYLLLALRGRASFLKGEWDAAGQCFILAREFNKGKERAETNYATGLELTRRSVEAAAQARHVIATFPGAIRPWAVLARCDSAASPEALWEEIPLFARQDEEVLVGVAMNALNHNSLGFARSLLEPLAGKDSDWPAPLLFLAQIRIQQTIMEAPKHLDGALHEYAGEDGNQIFDLLDKAIAIASRTNDRLFITEGLILRAEFQSAFNNFAAAHADFARVPAEQQSSAEFLTRYGKFLAISGNDGLAIQTLTRAYETSPNSRAGMMLALKLRSQKDGKSARYIELLQFCLDDPDCTQRHLALLLLLDRLIELGDQAGGTQLINSTRFDLLGSSTRDAASRLLEHTSTQPLTPENATNLASSAVEEGDISTLFFVGEVLQRCGCRRESLPIWQKLSEISPSIRDAHRLVESARLNDRVDLILDTCRTWRERGIFDPYLIEAEIGYLEEHAPLEALRVLESYLPHSATRCRTLLWRSWFGFKLDRPELLSLNPDDLPNPTDAGPLDGRVVVQLLAQSGQPQAAWSYAYRLYKAFTRDARVCGTLATLHLQCPEALDELPRYEVTAVGTCIEYLEHGTVLPRYMVIEEDESCGLLENEVRPDSSLAKVFLGRKVGETFNVASYSGVDVAVNILAIHNKMAFRAAKLSEDWLFLFPEDDTLQKFHLTLERDSDLAIWDISPMYRAIQGPKRNFDNLIEIYRDSGVPLLAMMSRASGRHPLDIQWAIMTAENPIFHCCDDSSISLEATSELVEEVRPLIIDMSAIGTLWQIGMLDILKSIKSRILIAPATWESLIEFRRVRNRSRPTVAIATDDAIGFQFQEQPADVMQTRRDFLEDCVKLLKECSTLHDAEGIYTWSSDKRAETTEILGEHGAASIALAQQTGGVLWTDDKTVAFIAMTEFNVGRVWTQSVLLKLFRDRQLTQDQYDLASAKLVASGYQCTLFQISTIFTAAAEANWSATHWLLRGVLNEFGIKRHLASRIKLAAEVIVQIYNSPLIDLRKDGVVLALIDRVVMNADPRKVVEVLYNSVKVQLNYNHGHFKELLNRWLNLRLLGS